MIYHVDYQESSSLAPSEKAELGTFSVASNSGHKIRCIWQKRERVWKRVVLHELSVGVF